MLRIPVILDLRPVTPGESFVHSFLRRLPALLILVAGLAIAAPGTADCQTLSLNGDWHFVADPEGSLKVEGLSSVGNIRPTRIPSSWQTQFRDLRDYAGVAWYWRTVNVHPPAPDQVALLRFGAVDYLAEVYVNGQKAGRHEGGYLPFEIDVTSLLRAGDNEIAVRVADAAPKSVDADGIKYEEIPHGKQNWYVQTSGLWQDVALDFRPRFRLGTVHVSAGADGRFAIAIPIINTPSKDDLNGARVSAEILGPKGETVWKESSEVGPGQERMEFSGNVSNPARWGLESPALYTLRLSLSSGDMQELRFGFRTFETRDGKFFLNGQAVYLRGALDQDFYPETAYTPPSLDYLRDEMRKAKGLGLNMLRCHIKVPDPRYLQAADETGILVWYEIPNWDKLTEDARRRAGDTLRGMVERDWNHPSIVIVSVINESWGADLREATERAWLKQAYGQAKKMVPNWLVVDNSACCQNFHMETDIADFHQYNAIPDYAADFDRFVEDMARRPKWLFSPYGDAAPRGDEPIVLSEFGNWGLPLLPEPRPWWFSRDFHGIDITLPEGVEKRFSDYGFDKLFADPNALAVATQWHQYRALKHEINTLRSLPGMEGYVITEFTDLNWEANGLLDMWRRPKAYGEKISKLQQDDLLVARSEKRNLTSGEKAEAEVYFSHYSQSDFPGASVVWRIENTALNGALPPTEVPAGSTARVGTIEFTAPEVEAPTQSILRVYLTWEGKTISENSVDLFFYPPIHLTLPPAVAFHDPPGRLRRLVNEMRARNYLAPSGTETLPVMVASVFDDEVKKTLQGGGLVILLPSDRQTLAPGLEIAPRSGSRLDGNWISGFLWIRKGQPPFDKIGFETLPGFEVQTVAPSTVVQGVPAGNFRDVLAGMFYGWIHSNVGVVVQAKYGSGKLFICTFSLATTYGSDPYATYLLDALVNYAVSGPTPQFEIPASGD